MDMREDIILYASALVTIEECEILYKSGMATPVSGDATRIVQSRR